MQSSEQKKVLKTISSTSLNAQISIHNSFITTMIPYLSLTLLLSSVLRKYRPSCITIKKNECIVILHHNPWSPQYRSDGV